MSNPKNSRFFISVLVASLFVVVISDLYPYQHTQPDSLELKIESATGDEKIILLHLLIRKNLGIDLAKANEYAEESLKYSLESSTDSLLAYSYYWLGVINYYGDQWTLSSKYYLKALENKWTQSNYGLKYKCMNNLGINNELLGNYEKSADYYYKTLNAMIELKDSSMIANAYNNLGLLLTRMEDFEQAEEKFRSALKIYQKYDYKDRIALCHQNLSIVYLYMGDFTNARTHFDDAVSYSEYLHDPQGLTVIYQDYAFGLSANARYNEALVYYNKAMELNDSTDFPITYYLICSGKGNVLFNLGRKQEAEELLLIADKGFKELSANVMLANNEVFLTNFYARYGNWNKFKERFESYMDLSKEMLKQEKIKSVSEMQVAYETEKKNQQIEFQKLEIDSQRAQIWLTSGIAVAIFAALLVVILTSRELKKKNKNLFESNMELSKRWAQMQRFYSSIEEMPNDERDNISLMSRLNKFIVEKEIYKKLDLNINFLAKELNTNSKYISKAINDEAGMNFNTYINTFRIEEAKKTLRSKETISWSLEAIAENCGFNNQTSFIHAFKKNTGLTPSAFRKAA